MKSFSKNSITTIDIQNAMGLAKKYHKGQKRKDGEDTLVIPLV